MLHLLLVVNLADSLSPPTLLARPRPDTVWVTTGNPLAPLVPFDPKKWTKEPPALPRKQRPALRIGLKLALPFVSGALWGLHETLLHHWPHFAAKHPNANPHWWNPAESWRNKYRDRDPEQGRTGWPAQVTDAQHLLVLGHNATLFGAGVSIAVGKRRRWWRYALDAGASLVAYSAGNFLIYNLLYHPP
jgi:hypothetical protein